MRFSVPTSFTLAASPSAGSRLNDTCASYCSRGSVWKDSRFTVCWCNSSIAARPYSDAGSITVAATLVNGSFPFSLPATSASITAAGCAATTAGVLKSGSRPLRGIFSASTSATHGARTRTSFSPSSAYVRSTMLAPARRASCQCFFVTSAPPAKKTKSIRSNEDASSCWMNAASSPAAVTCPAASSSSSSMKSDAPSNDSPSSSLTSFPASDDAPTIPIRYILFAMFSCNSFSLSQRHPQALSQPRSLPLAHTTRLLPPPSAPRVRQPRHHARHQIRHCNDDQHLLRKQHNQCAHKRNHCDQLERMAFAQSNLFRTPETPVAHHQKAGDEQQAQPHQRNPWIVDRRTPLVVNHRADHTRARRYRHPHKIFLTRSSGIARLRVDADIKPCQPTRSADQKDEADEHPNMYDLFPKLWVLHQRQHSEPPDIRQQTRRHAKRNHIRQRVQFPAKIARRVGHPRDDAIEPIEQNRDPQRQRRVIEVSGIRRRPLNALHNRIVSSRHVARGKQRRQHIHPAAWLSSHFAIGIHLRHPQRLALHQATTVAAEACCGTGSS